MRLAFAGYDESTDWRGNALGYTGAARDLFQHLQPHFDVDSDADTVLHFCAPWSFKPAEGKRNVLWTMVETEFLSTLDESRLLKADHVLTPSHWCRGILSKYLPRETPLTVVPLGYDPERWSFTPRELSANRPFRFFWIGAPNARKGFDHIGRAWDIGGFAQLDFVELYVKTTDETGEHGDTLRSVANVTFDDRFLPADELRELYDSAHCLVAPSTGEGFGLTMLEAMACGLPVITVKHSSQREFLKHDAWYADYEIVETRTTDGRPFNSAWPIPWDLARQMVRVMKRYPIALNRARKGARRAVEQYTWQCVAEQAAEEIKGADDAS